MTDRERLEQLLKEWRVSHATYPDSFLRADAANAGAITSIDVRSQVEFCFDAEGKFVGSATMCADSFRRRK